MKRNVILIATLLAGLVLPAGLVCSAEAPAVPEEIDRPTFGGDRIVEHLGSLLSEADPIVRQQAARALGQTHNVRAIPAIARATRDADPGVRSEAFAAAGEVGFDQARPVVIAGLDDEDPHALASALRALARLGLAEQADRVESLLAGDDPQVHSAALRCLTALGKAADGDQLATMLGSDDIPLRLAAVENARLAEPSESLVTALQERFARDESPAVRAGAIDALGQVAPKPSAGLIDQAGQSPNVLIRAAAVRAWTAARSSAKVAKAMDDPSSLVRLQAIVGAKALGLDSTRARLVELMLAAPDEPTHQAARRALAGMDHDDLKRRIAEALDKALTDGSQRANQLDRLSKAKNPKPAQVARQHRITRLADRLDRNAASCCWLLGHWGEKTIGYETLLSVLTRVKLDSPVLSQAAWALGVIGRAEATEPLAKTLERCKKRGVIYLRAMAAMRMGPPYSEEVTATVAVALARLGHRPSMEAMVYIARTRVMGTLLSRATRGVLEALGILMTDADRPMITELCAEILETPVFSRETHAAAALLVGREKLTAAAPAVRAMFDRRETRTTMTIAAWALGELTGQTPEIPPPIQNQGNWILRELE